MGPKARFVVMALYFMEGLTIPNIREEPLSFLGLAEADGYGNGQRK